MKRAALLAGALLVLAGGAVWLARTRVRRPFERVIVISLDTVRADQLGCYGKETAATPNLDALAARGVLFEEAMTAATTTLASHTAVFTGTYPHTHGVARNGFVVSQENAMLAEELRAAGYRTAAFLGSFALDRRFQLDQGFETWDQRFDVGIDASHEQEQRSAAAVTAAALDWVDRERPDRFLLFAHYFDAHAPYEAPPPFDTLHARAGAPKRATLADLDAAVRAQQRRTTGRELGVQRTIVGGLTPALLDGADGAASQVDEDLAALYAGEVSYLDQQLGRLLDGLERRGLLEDALIVVFADHGETFAEHADYWNHGLGTYATTAHVPLLVVARGRHAVAPRRVSEPVSTVDVLPTVCQLLELGTPPRAEGTSLVPWMRGEARTRGPIFCEATQPAGLERPRSAAAPWENAAKARCVRVGSCKLVRTPYLGREELYDLSTDPAERVNLLAAGRSPGACDVAVLRKALDEFERAARPLPSRFDPTQTLETQRKLRGTGYDEGAGADGEPTPR